VYLPSGRRIIFQSPRDYASAGEVDVYTMDANGDHPQRLFAHRGFDGVAVPSPDGRQIAFQRGTLDSTGENFHWELLLTDTLGRNERTLTANRWSSQVPSWTSGGTELVFYANPGGHDQLFVMNLATRAVRPLHASRANDTAPAASPDGRWVAFNSDRDGPGDLYVLEIASGNVTRLTTGLAVRSQPGWSRDGARLLFSATSTGVDEIYVVGRDGSGLVRLTHGTTGVR
jgi:Tol biopolymer transport system component